MQQQHNGKLVSLNHVATNIRTKNVFEMSRSHKHALLFNRIEGQQKPELFASCVNYDGYERNKHIKVSYYLVLTGNISKGITRMKLSIIHCNISSIKCEM